MTVESFGVLFYTGPDSDELGPGEVLLGRQRAAVHVRHVVLTPFDWGESQQPRKATIASLQIGGTTIAEGVAICNPDDNFSRKLGRKIAALRLNDQLRAQGYEAIDRGRVFDIVCGSRCKAVRVPESVERE